jgi:Zn-dependent oligopeptidase
MWAEIFELDILREFKKVGMFDREISKKYVEKILEPGSRKKTSILFEEFM